MAGRAPGPLRVPQEFWDRPEVRTALADRQFGVLFRLLTKYLGASQTQLAIAVGMTQGQVSTIAAGDRQITALDVAERVLDGLDAPDSARLALGLAPRRTAHVAAGTHTHPVREPSSITHHTKATDDDVQRRDLLRGGLSTLGAVLPLRAGLISHLDGIARALTPYDLGRSTDCFRAPLLTNLAQAVASAKRNYQACRYTAALSELPALLEGVNLACSALEGDDLQQANRLAADAYQVTGSVMLKLGDAGLATLAADRSMAAAANSEDSVNIAASARIVTHTLMSGGHPQRALEIATRAAERMDHEVARPSPEAISVYGALVLRGAIAAAMVGDRGASAGLLDEADDAARRLGRDDNAHWTAFGPTNVLLHRVSVALALGDAGTALHLANSIDLSRLALPERKAVLHLDVASAYAQWGRFEPAYEALRLAGQTAPEEIFARKSVHLLVADLAQRSPRTVRARVLELADEIGVDV